MPPSDEPQWNKIISLMIGQTSKGQIKWEALEPSAEHSRGDQTPTGAIYQHSVMGRNIEIFEYGYRLWVDEDTSHPSFGIALDLVGKTGGRWKIPVEAGLKHDLLEAVRRRDVEADAFAEELLEALKKGKNPL